MRASHGRGSSLTLGKAMRSLFLTFFVLFPLLSCGAADLFPALSDARREEIWQRPAKATMEELYSAALASGKAEDWEHAVFFLWCASIRLEFERAVFPPTEKGGN